MTRDGSRTGSRGQRARSWSLLAVDLRRRDSQPAGGFAASAAVCALLAAMAGFVMLDAWFDGSYGRPRAYAIAIGATAVVVLGWVALLSVHLGCVARGRVAALYFLRRGESKGWLIVPWLMRPRVVSLTWPIGDAVRVELPPAGLKPPQYWTVILGAKRPIYVPKFGDWTESVRRSIAADFKRVGVPVDAQE